MLDTIPNALARAAQQAGDHAFLDLNGSIYTYAEVDRRATMFAHSLQALGVAKGDRVLSLLDTSIDVFMVWFAAAKLGAIWVPINLAYRDEYLRHQVSDSGAKLVICEAHYAERIAAISTRLDEVQHLLVRGEGPLPELRFAVAALDDHRGRDDTPLPTVVSPAETAFIVYTSGTTGPSKGCMLSQNLLCHLGRQHIAAVPHGPGDKSFTPLPLFHMAGLTSVLGALIAQISVAVWARFSVSTFWEDIEQSGANNACFMATIFPLIAYAPDSEAMKRCHGRLKMVTGVPITAEIRRIWQERFGVGVMNSYAYGQTEGSRLAMVRHDEPLPPEGSAGRIAPEFDLRIFGDDGAELPEGQVGEIVFRPREPHIMFQGYWRRPEATEAVWRDLWMHTGDLGRIEQGVLYFMDRKKDYLRARGENISSFEVESTYAIHPAVLDVAVHAVGEKAGDDEVKVTIVLRPDTTLDHAELCHWSIERLPHFAVPRYYEFRAELPKNPVGKVLKYQLRDEGITSVTWDREEAGIIVRRR